MQKIRTALLSYGMSGKVFHAPFIEQHPGFKLTGSWERSKKIIQQDYSDVRSYPTLTNLLQDAVDLVVVNTPIETHYQYAKQALLAGKHVIVEKAFTTTVAEAEELKVIAEQQKVKLSIYQNRRWDSDFKTVQSILSQKLLGDIVEGEIHFDRFNPSLSPKQHKETKNAGAGIIMDLGSHSIDQALCLFGMPEAVFADLRKTRLHSEIEDYFDILLYYPSFRIRLKATFFAREPIPSYIFHGKKGSLLKKRGDIQEEDLKVGKKPNLPDWGKEPKHLEGILHTETNGDILKENISTSLGNYYEYYDLMYQAITQNKEVPVTASEGIQTMKIIEIAVKSSNQKRVISLNNTN